MHTPFNGIGMNIGNLPLLSGAITRSISAENRRGEQGRGGAADTGTGESCARELGRGWKVSPSIDIAAGETTELADIAGPGAIQSLWFGGYVGRDFILRFYWEEQDHPSVESPLADFFACGWESDERGPFGGPHPQISSLPVAVNPNRGLNCFWEMPFRRRCRITVENIGPEKRTLYYQINYVLTEVPEHAAYFHARFRRTNPVPYREDYVIVDGIEGQGHYVGTALFVG